MKRLLGSPYGVAKGCIKAFKFHQAQQAQAAVAQVVPALKQAAPDAKETAAALFRSLSSLPQGLRGPVVKSLAEQFSGGLTGDADRVMQAVDAMPEADREALVRKLQDKLKPTFEAVAANDAQASITLQQDAPAMHALKLKPRRNAKP